MGQMHNINPHQLTLFERAGDLADPEKFSPDDLPYYNSHEEMVSDKLAESKMFTLSDAKEGKPLYESIKQKGVMEPVSVEVRTDYKTKEPKNWLSGGHHRVFAQNDIDPHAWIPVKWSDED